ncbi:hypothetical protein Aab01nite_06770 [Paractinoplanes abujensis]|nr:hypothetical protein Aab01nite_06770 [Actinoplanes abujensis]
MIGPHRSEFDTGGHFAAIEVPELLVEDTRTFFRPLRCTILAGTSSRPPIGRRRRAASGRRGRRCCRR